MKYLGYFLVLASCFYWNWQEITLQTAILIVVSIICGSAMIIVDKLLEKRAKPTGGNKESSVH